MSHQSTSRKRGLLERLDAGDVIIGDGGFVIALEKRCYVKAGDWTPEVTVEHPEAVRQLHREFLNAGSDVMQAFSFYASDDKLALNDNKAATKCGGSSINRAACQLAREVASEGDALVLGGVSQTPAYAANAGKLATQAILKRQLDVFVEENMDFILCEYFEHVEEAEWAVEEALKTGLPVACTLCCGPEGDAHGVSVGDCAVRLAKAGAQLVGVNCHFDPFVSLKAMQLMKTALDAANLHPYLMVQPLGMMTPDADRHGYLHLPEFPFAMEPRICTRWEMHRFAREAYDLGVRYIGGCCGFEAYHIRAVAEELSVERQGRLPAASAKHAPWGANLQTHHKPCVRARASKEYWQNLNPSSGRPNAAAFSQPDTAKLN